MAPILLPLILCGCTGHRTDVDRDPFSKQVPRRHHLVELDEEWLYVLDPDSGLDIINVFNSASPTFFERVAGTDGEVIEMFLDHYRMYVMYDSSRAECVELPDLDPSWTHHTWTEFAIIAHVPDEPLLASRFCLPGQYMESAKQGDFLYVLTQFGDESLLLSIDVSDPFAPVIVDVEHEVRGSLGAQLHLARDALFVAVDAGGMALIRYFDVSDDDGAVVRRGEIEVSKNYLSPVFMDHHMGHLSVVVDKGGGSSLHLVDVRDPDHLVIAGSREFIASGEMLWDAVFEDDIVFITTYSQYPGDHLDNLWIISREDATYPSHLSNITIPSWSHGFTLVGSQLIAIGRGEHAGSAAVSLYNVVDLEDPEWVDTELFGHAAGPTGWYLDVRGVGVMQRGELADLPLIVVPYTRFLWDGYECIPERHFQLLDARWTSLHVRGDWTPLERHGRTEEVVQVGNKVYAISDVSVTTLGMMDRDAPQEHVMLTLGGDAADGCGQVRHNLLDVRDEVVSFFDLGCSVAGPGRASSGSRLLLAALLAVMAWLRRRRR
ncbi:MAG: beta-propeller domain-containing protein [Deltaproteobacteria bacterium]|nr:beta-propeller domain-containing protein [Deltaproteobacteria bacterium]